MRCGGLDYQGEMEPMGKTGYMMLTSRGLLPGFAEELMKSLRSVCNWSFVNN